MRPDVSVVVITRDRAELLATTLGHLGALPERPPVIVVDNGSVDGSPEMVRDRYPEATVVALPVNRAAAARQIGARLAATPYVAFADDDSWWSPGGLERAVAHLDAHPTVALVAARVLVGPDERDDPTSVAMANGPLPPVSGLPGVPVGGFLACALVVRREAFLDVGGFQRAFQIGGEEALLAIDLLDAGWALHYLPDVVVHHHPATGRDPARRRRAQARNALWTAWLWRSPAVAVRATLRTMAGACGDPALAAALVDAAGGWGWVRRQRRRVPPSVEAQLRRLELAG
ncbi:MAG: glycosyltransferase [Actinobacteria bacterium]|nr:glycosyltransferase [Actinomycetota bacterium]